MELGPTIETLLGIPLINMSLNDVLGSVEGKDKVVDPNWFEREANKYSFITLGGDDLTSNLLGEDDELRYIYFYI
jgi:hypothetical protein